MSFSRELLVDFACELRNSLQSTKLLLFADFQYDFGVFVCNPHACDCKRGSVIMALT